MFQQLVVRGVIIGFRDPKTPTEANLQRESEHNFERTVTIALSGVSGYEI